MIKLLEELTGHKLEINIDPSLVRPNEGRLFGDPSKLESVLGKVGFIHLQQTLSWMLKVSCGMTPTKWQLMPFLMSPLTELDTMSDLCLMR